MTIELSDKDIHTLVMAMEVARTDMQLARERSDIRGDIDKEKLYNRCLQYEKAFDDLILRFKWKEEAEKGEEDEVPNK